MGKVIVIVAVAMLVSSCSRSEQGTQQASLPNSQGLRTLTGVEGKVLNDVARIVEPTCHSKVAQCRFSSSSSGGEITVKVRFFSVGGDPPKYVLVPGREATYVYSSAGKYVRSTSTL